MTAWLGPEEWGIVALSLRVALVAIFCALPFAVAAAMALARWSGPAHAALNLLVHLPLVLPPVVTGYALLLLFGAQGPVGQFTERTFGLVFAFRWTGAALAAAVMAFPLIVRAIRLAVEAIDPKLNEAARTLGASRSRVFLTLTLPLISPGILAGLILGFAKALGEFGATITFAANIPGQTQTLPTAIYTLLQVPGQEGAATRLILVSVVLSAAALLASEMLARRVRRRIGGGP